MSLRYKHLSTGYIGDIGTELTLNSHFWSLFYNQENDLGSILLFPQRIPRSGLFDELRTLETTYYQKRFHEKILNIKNNQQMLFYDLKRKPSEKNARCFINVYNICLRYGCFTESLSLIDYQGNFALELALLKASHKIEECLSQGLPLSIGNYLFLANKFISDANVTDREKIMLLNQLIVTHYRYKNNNAENKQIFVYAKQLLRLIDKFHDNQIMNKLYSSVAYRGLAMVSQFGAPMQEDLLNQAENISLNIKGKTKIEEILILENQYICFQTMAKWHLHNNNFEKSKIYLKRMIKVDPYDSTGHSELGFHYIKEEKYDDAAICFKKAMQLGPPGTGMNTYYYAKCLEKMGQHLKAITYLYKSAELDKQAISPWLDLMEYYGNKNKQHEAFRIAKHIYTTPILMEQLEENEITSIQKIIN